MKPVRFYLIAIVIILADQITKSSIIRTLALGQTKPALGNFLVLTYTRNTGGAFSLMQGGNYLFIVVASLAIVALLFAYHKYQFRQLSMSAALSLALGGAVGNLVDRIRFGYVVDFFDFQGGTGHTLWPIFNVADSAISVGIVVLILRMLFAKEKPADNDKLPATN